jgi:hypothetical protein
MLRKKWEYSQVVHQLFIEFKKVCNSVRREVLYNILIELEGIHETSQADFQTLNEYVSLLGAPDSMAEL